jgi:hypothetical protein
VRLSLLTKNPPTDILFQMTLNEYPPVQPTPPSTGIADPVFSNLQIRKPRSSVYLSLPRDIMGTFDVSQPSTVFLPSGADSLASGKLGCFNVTMQVYAHCVQFLRKQNGPLILLGGGGLRRDIGWTCLGE